MRRITYISIIVTLILTVIFFLLYRIALSEEPYKAFNYALNSLLDLKSYEQDSTTLRKVTFEIPILEFEGNQLPKDQLVGDTLTYRIDRQSNLCKKHENNELRDVECPVMLDNYLGLNNQKLIIDKILQSRTTYEVIPDTSFWSFRILDEDFKQVMLDNITQQIQNQVIDLGGEDIQFEQLTVIKPPLEDVLIDIAVLKDTYTIDSITLTTGIGFSVEFNAIGPSINQIRQFDQSTPTTGKILITQLRQKDTYRLSFTDSHKPKDNPLRLLLGL